MTLDDVANKHRRKIARDTLRMSDAMARVMGGMTKDEAREVLGPAHPLVVAEKEQQVLDAGAGGASVNAYNRRRTAR